MVEYFIQDLLATGVPVVVRFAMPDPAPSSESCDVSKIWFVSVPQPSPSVGPMPANANLKETA